MRIWPVLVALCAFLQTACSSSNIAGSDVIRITPTVDVILVGDAVQLSATSTSLALTPTSWDATPSTVGGIDSSGVLVGRANGIVNVTATIAGRSSTMQVRVAPRFAGNWSGTYTITDCSRDGAFEIVNLCSAVRGTSSPISWSASQTKLSVSNAFSVGAAPVSGSAQGTVADAGTLVWAGSRVESSGVGDIAVSMKSSDSAIAGSSFVGTVIEQWTLANSPGSAQLTGRFVMTLATSK